VGGQTRWVQGPECIKKWSVKARRQKLGDRQGADLATIFFIIFFVILPVSAIALFVTVEHYA